MNAEQLILVQESWRQLQPRAAEAGVMLYDRLFERDPAIRGMFKGDMEEQGEKLMQMIGLAIEGLSNPESIMGALQMLGVVHAEEYGVTEREYDAMEEALIETLMAEFGEGLTEDLETAWRKVYRAIVNIMSQGAKVEADAA